MSWSNINLNEISTQLELIPEGNYVFSISPGAKEDEAGRLLLSAHIVGGGDFNGRKVTFSYPDPERYDWSATMVKRLQEATGVDVLDGETPVQFFNRVAGNHFGAPIRHEEYTPEGADKPRKSAKLNIFKTYAAA